MQGVRHQGGQDGSHPPVVVLQADRGGRLQTVDGIEPGVNGGTGGRQVWSLTQFYSVSQSFTITILSQFSPHNQAKSY